MTIVPFKKKKRNNEWIESYGVEKKDYLKTDVDMLIEFALRLFV